MAGTRKGRMTVSVVASVAIIGALAAWTVVTHHLYFPSLFTVLRSFGDTWPSHFTSDILPSLKEMAVGFALALVIGLPVGCAIGRSAILREIFLPVMDFARSVPPVALLPIAVTLLGLGFKMRFVLITAGCVWPIILNATDGVRNIDPMLVDMASAYRLRWWSRWTKVLLPAAGPAIFTGIRVALPIAILLMVVSEMVGDAAGIGFYILNAQQNFAIVQMWSGVILVGLLGVVINYGVLGIERWALRWHPKAGG